MHVSMVWGQGWTTPGRMQRGIALLISLIALAGLSIAAVTLLRSVTTGVQISGNLAFRNAAVHGADAAIEQARAWLAAMTPFGQ